MTTYGAFIIGMFIGYFIGVAFMGILSMASQHIRRKRVPVERCKTDKEIARKLLGGAI